MATDRLKRKEELDIPKLIDARFAGTANSRDCTLILTQGDGANHAATTAGLSVLGEDYYGVFPVRVKFLGARKSSHDEVVDIRNIINILGLQHGKVYEDVNELRYGHLMIYTNQYHDGTRFKGQLINFLRLFWPSLLKLPNFLRVFVTPILTATNRKTKEVKLFYTNPEYEAWAEELGNKPTEYIIHSYKGLPSFNHSELVKYFANHDCHVKDFLWVDNEDGDAIELAFSRKKIDERKEWVRAFQPSTILDIKKKCIRYRDFIHIEYRQYLVADLQKSVPSMVDGLKPDQRSILFVAHTVSIQNYSLNLLSDCVFSSSAYHHGEASLFSTILRMAHNFVGSNNINLLQPKYGLFGTRRRGGKDRGTGKHLSTELSPITRYLFHKDDELILKYLKEGDRSAEPALYIPIIPMVLVNGCEGSGSGWSSFIPNYNPQDIICNLKRLLNGETMVRMHPWYKGFNGTIQHTASGDTQYTTTGNYKVKKDQNALSVTELPVRRWIQDYTEFLKAASQDGKDKTPFVKAYTSRSYYEVNFEIFMTQDQMSAAEQEGFLKKFKLTTELSTADMHLFDANGVLKKYDTPEQILKEFFDLRLEFYKDRRTAKLRDLMKALSLLENKLKFVDQIVQRKILVWNSETLLKELKRNGIDPLSKEHPIREFDYLLSVDYDHKSYEKMEDLQREMDAKKEEFNFLTKTPPESLWLKDLTALDHQLKEQDKIHDMEPKDESDSDEEELEADIISTKQDKVTINARKQEDGNYPSTESSPEIAAPAEDPKKKAAKRAADSPLPEGVNKKRHES